MDTGLILELGLLLDGVSGFRSVFHFDFDELFEDAFEGVHGGQAGLPRVGSKGEGERGKHEIIKIDKT